jgi:hypothetical protein
MADDTTTPASPESSGEPINPAPEAPQEITAEAPAEQATTPPVEPEPEPAVAATVEVPPLQAPPAPEGASTEGGEWDLLVSKLRDWLASGRMQQIWSQARNPLTALAALVALLVVLRIYSALVGALESLPLVPGLLELAGLIWLVRYGLPKLVRSRDRQQLLDGIKDRRKDFLG